MWKDSSPWSHPPTFYHRHFALMPQIHPASRHMLAETCPAALFLHIIMWSGTSSGWWSARGVEWLRADVLSFQPLTCNDSRQVQEEKPALCFLATRVARPRQQTPQHMYVCVCVWDSMQRLGWASLACWRWQVTSCSGKKKKVRVKLECSSGTGAVRYGFCATRLHSCAHSNKQSAPPPTPPK